MLSHAYSNVFCDSRIRHTIHLKWGVSFNESHQISYEQMKNRERKKTNTQKYRMTKIRIVANNISDCKCIKK